MQQPAWKSRALAALDQQARYELNSGYDEKESLIAVAAMKAWVQQNICPSKTEFLQQLEHYYQDIQANWAFPGKYSGGKATLGSCRRMIQQAVLSEHDISEL